MKPKKSKTRSQAPRTNSPRTNSVQLMGVVGLGMILLVVGIMEGRRIPWGLSAPWCLVIGGGVVVTLQALTILSNKYQTGERLISWAPSEFAKADLERLRKLVANESGPVESIPDLITKVRKIADYKSEMSKRYSELTACYQGLVACFPEGIGNDPTSWISGVKEEAAEFQLIKQELTLKLPGTKLTAESILSAFSELASQVKRTEATVASLRGSHVRGSESLQSTRVQLKTVERKSADEIRKLQGELKAATKRLEVVDRKEAELRTSLQTLQREEISLREQLVRTTADKSAAEQRLQLLTEVERNNEALTQKVSVLESQLEEFRRIQKIDTAQLLLNQEAALCSMLGLLAYVAHYQPDRRKVFSDKFRKTTIVPAVRAIEEETSKALVSKGPLAVELLQPPLIAAQSLLEVVVGTMSLVSWDRSKFLEFQKLIQPKTSSEGVTLLSLGLSAEDYRLLPIAIGRSFSE